MPVEHSFFRTNPHVSTGISIRSKQKGDTKECSITLDLTLDTGTVPVYFPFCRHCRHSSFDWSSKLKGLHSSRSNPDVGVAGIYEPRCCPQKADQETPLKNHQEYGKRHAKHRYREAGSIVNDILPSKFHKSCATDKFGEQRVRYVIQRSRLLRCGRAALSVHVLPVLTPELLGLLARLPRQVSCQ